MHPLGEAFPSYQTSRSTELPAVGLEGTHFPPESLKTMARMTIPALPSVLGTICSAHWGHSAMLVVDLGCMVCILRHHPFSHKISNLGPQWDGKRLSPHPVKMSGWQLLRNAIGHEGSRFHGQVSHDLRCKVDHLLHCSDTGGLTSVDQTSCKALDSDAAQALPTAKKAHTQPACQFQSQWNTGLAVEGLPGLAEGWSHIQP